MYILSNDQVKSLLIGFLGTMFCLTSCSDSSNPGVEETRTLETETEQVEMSRELSVRNTNNDAYRFSTEIPKGWAETTNVGDDGSVIINMYPENKVAVADLPISVQAQPNIDHIDVYPKGLSSKFPYGENLRLRQYEGDVPAAELWDENESRVFLLGNGEAWAYWLYPKDRPAGWEKEGFIFAQIAIDNFSSECYDHITGDLKEMQICKPIEGDELQYYGRINAESMAYVSNALTTMDFQ